MTLALTNILLLVSDNIYRTMYMTVATVPFIVYKKMSRIMYRMKFMTYSDCLVYSCSRLESFYIGMLLPHYMTCITLLSYFLRK
jgi:hypothetical protein